MTERLHVAVRGTVQGVGFRPFVARLADELGLVGSVRNAPGEVLVDVQGPRERLVEFEQRLTGESPGEAVLEPRSPKGDGRLRGFRIERSLRGRAGRVPIPPDRAPCAVCRREVDSKTDRHAGYPFTSCTECGPRFSILREPPYDRVRTAMDRFLLCRECEREVRNPADRRFHAQAVACPACGPSLTLSSPKCERIAQGATALEHAVALLRRGDILAVKGVGGYQLWVDARDEAAVARLRARKRRPEKPLAVLFRDVEEVCHYARMDADERRAIADPAAPIVLLDKHGEALAPSVAPRTPRIGAMLPASPLHHVLASRLGFPVVCTSGNLHDEPIAIDDAEARERLSGVADALLGYDREIVRRLDDSVVQVVHGRMRVLRAGRGLTPAVVSLPVSTPPLLATGGHLKQAPAAALDERAVLWPHVGDLYSEPARRAMAASIADLVDFLGLEPAWVVTDRHPDYATTLWADRSGLPRIAVQHHHAHVAACLAEHGVERGLGVAWDGMGLGDDGMLWGGEFLEVGPEGCTRVAHLRSFPLPGADAAARDAWRALAGACVAAGCTPEPLDDELMRFVGIARAQRLSARTTSVGRLFDAAAGLTGLARHSSYEAQAAMALEHAASPGARTYPFELHECELDWRPAWAAMVAERADAGRVASRFHATLVAMIVRVAEERHATTVALTGGAFQNRLLLASALQALEERGIRALAPERFPAGDGGLALGQAWIAAHALTRGGA